MSEYHDVRPTAAPDSAISEEETTTPTSAGTTSALIFALIFATVAFVSGVSIGTQGQEQTAGLFSFFTSDAAEPKPDEVDLEEFWEVWGLMEEKFAAASSSEPVSREERIEGAINGLVGSYGDAYSVYLPPADAAAFDEDISGNFSGVGMEVGMREGVVTVISPLPGTPADEAGILAGDIIVRIDGTSTERMSIDEAVKLIRGEKGAEVTLTIAREGETDFLEISIVRDNIDIPTIDTEVRDEIFIVSLYSFNAVAEVRMQQALQEFVQSDAEKLVLDLRGNPGGFLQSAVGISSFFLPTGTVIVTEEFSDDRADKVFRSQGKVVRSFDEEDFVVLVDGGSASASEIVAGALAENGVATLVGSQTFGKGSVQELVNLDSGASLKVTVARWLTPNGTSISEGGITPEVEVERTAEERLNNVDPQLDAAIEVLRGTYEPPATSTPDVEAAN